jgi:hypothetical protein
MTYQHHGYGTHPVFTDAGFLEPSDAPVSLTTFHYNSTYFVPCDLFYENLF